MNDQAQFFMCALKGKRVKLSLKTSWYSGVVQRICPNKMLVLSDVVTANGCKVQGSKLFFGRDVMNVELEEEPNEGSDDVLDQQQDTLEEKMSTSHEDKAFKFIVVDQLHEKFGPAVTDIQKQSVIGVGADGVELHKHGRLCWLQIATGNIVYLFDVLSLGTRGFHNGLRMILENKTLLKVIHDCRPIAGCLFAQYGVKLTNVFDTQVADVMCFHTETGGFLPDRVSTLPEVLSLYVNVRSPQLSSLRLNSHSIKKETHMWYKRPCPLPLLKTMALSVMHLKSLRVVLMDNLMTDFMMLVDAYLTSSHCGHIDMDQDVETMLELPCELKQLQQLNSERQEQAKHRYAATKPGLLQRFGPWKPSDTTASSPGVSRVRL